MPLSFVGIIPARYESSRFPGKPLCNIAGKSMIQWVWESAKKWEHWKEVYIATDDLRIERACEDMGIPCMQTASHHTDCLDRAAEVVERLESYKALSADRYVVIQGDEPLFNADSLNTDLTPPIVNFYTEVQDQDELYDPNAVKVVVSTHSRAIYFSRYTVPYHDAKTRRINDMKLVCYKQLGIYSFSAEGIAKYASHTPSYLENIEGIGLNRLIEREIPIHMRYTEHDSISVDTPADRDRVEEMIRERSQACITKE